MNAFPLSYREQLQAAKRRIIQRALREQRKNVSAAARMLGVNRTYFYRLAHRVGVTLKPKPGAHRGSWGD